MKRLFAFAALLAATTPAFAITGDWIEDTVHPYVGLVVFYNKDGGFVWRCSGSLISPTKLVTAGHCTDAGTAEEPGAASARVYFQQDAGAHFDPSTGKDPVTGYPETCAPGTLGTLCATSVSIHNYGFANFAGFPNTHDVGVVILEQPITLPKYGVLPTAGVLESVGQGKKNSLFTVSGYGLTLRVNVHTKLSNVSFRERLMASSSLVNLGSSYTDGYNVQTQGNGNNRGGTCSGDSGGPVFLGGSNSNLIVAVTSFGLNELCRGTDYGYRIDRQEVLDWINSR
jgi:secreted trypsin-like serine protease